MKVQPIWLCGEGNFYMDIACIVERHIKSGQASIQRNGNRNYTI